MSNHLAQEKKGWKGIVGQGWGEGVDLDYSGLYVKFNVHNKCNFIMLNFQVDLNSDIRTLNPKEWVETVTGVTRNLKIQLYLNRIQLIESEH